MSKELKRRGFWARNQAAKGGYVAVDGSEILPTSD